MSPAARVFIVRHGQTDRSARMIYSGRADIPLTAFGSEQARLAGERLADVGVDAVYSSPLIRARDTAVAIALASGAPCIVEPRLIEVDYGPIEGLDRAAARERYAERFTAWREDPYGSPLPGMEPLRDALARARDATADALAAHDCPVLVGHQGILRLVLVALGQIEPGAYFSTRLDEAQPLEILSPSTARPAAP
ncbi:MAG TPA: histidine phosphatase family protein [Solirubrobacteraceae bacterium]|nr:histidine phosphatase family protein [Solirubrobacteraceae bacterium]